MNLSKNILSKLKKAKELAETSPHPRYKFGCVIFKGRKYLSTGVNQYDKTSPDMIRFEEKIECNIHSEQQALIKYKYYDTVQGADIAVVRVGLDGHTKIGKPCKQCQKLLKAAKIRKVYYTSGPDEIEVMNL